MGNNTSTKSDNTITNESPASIESKKIHRLHPHQVQAILSLKRSKNTL